MDTSAIRPWQRYRLAGVAVLGAGALVIAACTPATPAAPAAATSPPANPAASVAAPAAPKTASSPMASAPAPSPAGAKPAAKPSGPPIKIGVLDDVTGVGAIEGALMRISSDLVIQQTNESGGINGRPLEAVYVDPKGDAAQAQQLAQQLVQQDNVDVLAGAVFSPECLGVQTLAERLQIVYVALNGCASDKFTSASCNRYSFRVYPAGRQNEDPAYTYEVGKFGKRWAIIYPDYAFGQSQMQTSEEALKTLGADFSVKIPVPLGETNVTPYVTRLPTDGSIDAVIVSMTGSDLARTISVMEQFGITKKVPMIVNLGKESFAGVYPDALTGAYITGYRPSEGIPGNADDQAFLKAWKQMAQKDSSFTGPLGGPDKATPGTRNGYGAYASMKALVLAMRASSFSGKADTDKLISAFENLTIPQGPDLPGGPMIMNKADHQGRMTLYLMQVNGQTEDIIQTFPADTLPMIGNCVIKN